MTDPRAYAIRSPLDWARRIAFSGVPLQIWWSWKDKIVVDQVHGLGLLFRDIKRLNPAAPVARDWAPRLSYGATSTRPGEPARLAWTASLISSSG